MKVYLLYEVTSREDYAVIKVYEDEQQAETRSAELNLRAKQKHKFQPFSVEECEFVKKEESDGF